MADQTLPDASIHVGGGSRLLAFLAYLLGPLGWVIALLFGRKDPFVGFHVRQSISLFVTLFVGVLAWVAIAYLSALVPYFGPLIGFALFALVISLAISCVILWIMGMIGALRGRYRVLPLVGQRASKWLGGTTGSVPPTAEVMAEAT